MDATAAATTHPLDPLTAPELERAVAVLRQQGLAGDGLRVISIDLLEPDKAALAAWRDDGPAPAREAQAVLLAAGSGDAVECTIDLDRDQLADRRSLDGMQPAISMDEYVEAGAACRADAGYRRALARRGIEGDQVELVHIEPWTVGDFEQPGRRVARCLSWLRSSDDDVNPYGRPLGGLVAVIDITEMRVLRIDDHGPLPVPEARWDYRDGGPDGYRQDQRPIEITQPHGVSFELHGRELRWQKWRLRVGFSHRESLVLHEIAYQDNGRLRPICHRASIAELVIPYGDPNPTVHFKNVFDIGEYGVGPLVNALELGCDCLGDITYMDACCVNTAGEVVTLPNAICIHEEDHGILWKHRDDTTGQTHVARSRRLVISCITTVGNYEYGFFWYLYQDGRIEFEGKLTGIILTAGVPAGQEQHHATEVAPGVAAG
jgi:primary-amine oxidase